MGFGKDAARLPRHASRAACSHPCGGNRRHPGGCVIVMRGKGSPGLPLCRLADKGRKTLVVATVSATRPIVTKSSYKRTLAENGRRRPLRLRRCFGCPGVPCRGCRGLCCVSFCLGVFPVCALASGSLWRARWRCCFAVWLRSPGGACVSCAGSFCPLSAWCAGRPSLVPGSSLWCSSPFRVPALVAARRRVCVRWLRACGLPSSVLVSPCFALPFPSVLSAAWRSGALPVLWFRCRLAGLRRARAGLSSGGW